MEKPPKIAFSVFAVLLYWLAASGFSYGINHGGQVDQNIDAAGFHIFVAEELPFASDFAVKEGAGFSYAGNAAPHSHKQPQLYKAVLSAMEVLVACAVLQYVSQLRIHPVRIRKSDMLFPFHYFFEPARA